jgi:hypothetical protein
VLQKPKVPTATGPTAAAATGLQQQQQQTTTRKSAGTAQIHHPLPATTYRPIVKLPVRPQQKI